MALATQGFALSANDRAPDIPSNVGRLDVKSIYDRVTQGLDTAERVRTTLARQQATDQQLMAAEMAAATQQSVLPVQGEADIATARRTSALASPDIVGAERGRALAGLDADLIAEQNRRQRERALAGLSGGQQLVYQKNGFPLATSTSIARNADGTVTTASNRDVRLGGETIPVQSEVSSAPYALLPGIPAEQRAFESMISTFSPEEQAIARKVKAGLEARAVTAAPKLATIQQPNGAPLVQVFDPKTRSISNPTIKGPASLLATPAASGAATPGAAAPITDSAAPSSISLLGQSTADKASAAADATSEAKLQAERKEKLPKAQSALQAMEANTSRVDDVIDKAIAMTDRTSSGYGSLANGLPTTKARALKNLLLTIRANTGFDQLQVMRQNSPTGGALGSVSDAEGAKLDATIASLDQGLDPDQLKEALRTIKEVRREMLTNVRKAYDQDFQLAKGGGLPKTSDETGRGRTQAESPAAKDNFTVGQTAVDANGNKAIYRGNGQWEEMK